MENKKDLLHGNIRRQLLTLMFPLIIGNILQQFYNTIDSIIVGRYVGDTAFAAVGVAGSVMNLFIFMLNGGCNGISVVFAELYGQKKWDRLRKESFLSLLLGLGTAIATVTAQLIASLICVWIMKRKHKEFFFHKKGMALDKGLMKKTAKFGSVSALHQSSLYIGKLLVQGTVNTGGTDMISAYTATMRIEGFANSFGDSGAVAMSVFVAQNHGAGKKERVRDGLRKGLSVMNSDRPFLL